MKTILIAFRNITIIPLFCQLATAIPRCRITNEISFVYSYSQLMYKLHNLPQLKCHRKIYTFLIQPSSFPSINSRNEGRVAMRCMLVQSIVGGACLQSSRDNIIAKRYELN